MGEILYHAAFGAYATMFLVVVGAYPLAVLAEKLCGGETAPRKHFIGGRKPCTSLSETVSETN